MHFPPASPDPAVQHRIGQVTLTVLRPDGQPLRESVLTIEQRRHAFAFGNIAFDFVRPVGGPDPKDAERVDGFGGARRLSLEELAARG